MHPARLHPTLFHDLRSRPQAPPMAERWPPARMPDQFAPFSPLAIYSPLMMAMAPRGCPAEALRYPVAAFAQLSVDVLAGGSALAVAAGLLLFNRREMAGAFISEHKLNIVLATIVFVQAAAAGAAFGVCVYMLA